MKGIAVFILLAYYIQSLNSQRCRQVCDVDVAPSNGGEKGEVGAPGKAGPVGMKGDKGEVGGVGEKGTQRESCALGSFESEMRQKMAALEILLTPASCLTSSVYGRQTLRSGEEMFCDNGWTVFQKRFDHDVTFERVWIEYKNGFGNLSGDFWLGLEKIHGLTMNRGCKLRVDVWDGTNRHEFAEYSDFYVQDEDDNYRLRVAGYSGTAGDGLTEHVDENGIHDNMQFTTKDRDNDLASDENCALGYESGWWFNRCYHSNLNRPAGRLDWDDSSFLQSSSMKLRCD